MRKMSLHYLVVDVDPSGFVSVNFSQNPIHRLQSNTSQAKQTNNNDKMSSSTASASSAAMMMMGSEESSCPASPTTSIQSTLEKGKQLRERLRQSRESARAIRQQARLAIKEARNLREEMEGLLDNCEDDSLIGFEICF